MQVKSHTERAYVILVVCFLFCNMLKTLTFASSKLIFGVENTRKVPI